jgi:hypothetical protein
MPCCSFRSASAQLSSSATTRIFRKIRSLKSLGVGQEQCERMWPADFPHCGDRWEAKPMDEGPVRDALQRIAEQARDARDPSPSLLRRARLRAARTILVGLVGAILIAYGGVVGVGALLGAEPATPASGCDPSVAQAAGSGNNLSAVSAASDVEAWAVGWRLEESSSVRGVAEHWDGQVWTPIALPRMAFEEHLQGVQAISADDAWAVGAIGGPHGDNGETLVLHWDGSRWSRVPSPSPSRVAAVLFGIAALGPNDLWAVGGTKTEESTVEGGIGTFRTMAMHWDGRMWTIVPTPNATTGDNSLSSVFGVAPDDVWAVGSSRSASGAFVTLVEHWNGTTWAIVPSPTDGSQSFLNAVSAGAEDDAWAVGSSYRGTTEYPLIAHWDGASWSLVSGGTASQEPGALTGVAALAPDDVWAVGRRGVASATQPLVEHWDGKGWSVVASPGVNQDGATTRLNAVTGSGDGRVWAVGATGKAGVGGDVSGVRPFMLGCGQSGADSAAT